MPSAHQAQSPNTTRVIATLGSAQTLAWASTYYLPAVLAEAQGAELGLSSAQIFLAFSGALLLSGLMGPKVGHWIDRTGGRSVLVCSSVLLAAGLTLLGLSQGMLSLIAAWVVLGAAMGLGLYEAAFSTLVFMYGSGARKAITGITLIAGFASTVGWPLTSLLTHQFDWRIACFTWAAIHLVIGLPLNLSLPKISTAVSSPHRPEQGSNPPAQGSFKAVVLVAAAFGFAWFIATAMAAHLPRLLQLSGASVGIALAAASLVGPFQVLGRVAEFGWLRRYHALVSARVAAAAHPIGVLLLLSLGSPAVFVFAILHGMGNGVMTIAKGTVPLALFGSEGYGARLGWIMAPARIGQAFAPPLMGYALDRFGSSAALLTGAIGGFSWLALIAIGARSDRK
ncbi:MFS transporter [Chitinolyticbacter meiyuanensis]|uniref:MFS transporter n=1 Tax=Chitinolyticbacter meiyuanensis TaxID=682798 RepID=UPI0011E5FEDC|nr:MFS transporter [Chitinolyticbacter meiyuanensis]